MNDYPSNPYEGYTPNEPEKRPSLAPARPLQAARAAQAAASEDEWAGYTPNEPSADEVRPVADDFYCDDGAPSVNAEPPTDGQPAYDVPAYEPTAADSFDEEWMGYEEPVLLNDAVTVEDYALNGPNPYRSATWDEESEPEWKPTAASPYARPSTDDELERSMRFAPPPKFELPTARVEQPEPVQAPARQTPNVYRTRRQGAAQQTDYRVDAEQQKRRRRRRHPLRGALIALCVLAILAGLGYWQRDWLQTKLAALLGSESQTETVQAAQTTSAGYDAAPSLSVGDRARQGIAAVTTGVELESYAVTTSNVIARRQTAEGVYDYYLFTSDSGLLLGYYEGLGEDDFIVCPNDVYYVAESPYLVNSKGLPLIDASRYQQSIGADAVLGPMINGWSVLSNAEGTSCNFINADGTILSALWFAKTFPFTASSTLAYVDTGNQTDAGERYALYEITRTGEMILWEHAADMNGVLGCAGGVAVMASGDVILLDGNQTVLFQSDDVRMYADCGAMVARDAATGLYALYVNGEQHYDYAYDSIEPVAEDIRWSATQNGLYTQYVVSGMAYPLPLSHYFALKKGDEQEMVALSTASVYQLLYSK